MAQCSPLIRASQKPSETLQVARAQAAASSSSDRFARGFKRLLRGTSYIFSPNRKDKDRCVPPSRRLVPAWGLLPARARSDIASPFVAVPACARVPAQSQASAAAPPPRVPPHWQRPLPLASVQAPAEAPAVAGAAAPATVHPAGFARGRGSAPFRCRCASSCLRTG